MEILTCWKRPSVTTEFPSTVDDGDPSHRFGLTPAARARAPGRADRRGRGDVPVRRQNRGEFSKQKAGSEGITKQDVIPPVSDSLASLALIMVGEVGSAQ